MLPFTYVNIKYQKRFKICRIPKPTVIPVSKTITFLATSLKTELQEIHKSGKYSRAALPD